MDYKTIMTRLTLLSLLKPGDKLEGESSIVENNLFGKAQRTAKNLFHMYQKWSLEPKDSRETSLKYIEHTMEEAIKMVDVYAERDKEIAKSITDSMDKAMKGVNNLRQTYKSDKGFSSQLEGLISSLTLKTKRKSPVNTKPSKEEKIEKPKQIEEKVLVIKEKVGEQSNKVEVQERSEEEIEEEMVMIEEVVEEVIEEEQSLEQSEEEEQAVEEQSVETQIQEKAIIGSL